MSIVKFKNSELLAVNNGLVALAKETLSAGTKNLISKANKVVLGHYTAYNEIYADLLKKGGATPNEQGHLFLPFDKQSEEWKKENNELQDQIIEMDIQLIDWLKIELTPEGKERDLNAPYDFELLSPLFINKP